ncbi:hypothetical protein SO802_024297 [Lithocarpus litseifolius]|uniref:GDP-mannose 4,6-dehydratase n=1 Tax=Lithocarpus litseifolius TaxID=425828 RepID=A0AAW2CCG4_9ROSI
MKLYYADLTDASSLRRGLDTILPNKVYNLAAQSHVAVSFELPDYTVDVVTTGALRLLKAVRSHITTTGRNHRYYQVGLYEMFGRSQIVQAWRHHEAPGQSGLEHGPLISLVRSNFAGEPSLSTA